MSYLILKKFSFHLSFWGFFSRERWHILKNDQFIRLYESKSLRSNLDAIDDPDQFEQVSDTFFMETSSTYKQKRVTPYWKPLYLKEGEIMTAFKCI